MRSHIRYQLRCKSCGHAIDRSQTQMLELLWQQKMLRRASDPDPQVLEELYKAAGDRLPCEGCDRIGLFVEPAADEDDWDDARPCEVCNQPIPAERLEIFPDATRCAKCQDSQDQGVESDSAPEFCPRCGGLLQLRSARGAGLARYEMHCADCGHRGR